MIWYFSPGSETLRASCGAWDVSRRFTRLFEHVSTHLLEGSREPIDGRSRLRRRNDRISRNRERNILARQELRKDLPQRVQARLVVAVDDGARERKSSS